MVAQNRMDFDTGEAQCEDPRTSQVSRGLPLALAAEHFRHQAPSAQETQKAQSHWTADADVGLDQLAHVHGRLGPTRLLG